MAAKFAPEAEPLSAIAPVNCYNYYLEIDDKVTSLAPVRTTLQNLKRQSDKVISVRQAADPAMTRGAFLISVEKQVDAFGKIALDGLGKARQALADSTKTFETMLNDRVGIKPTANAARLQDRLVNMSDAERQKAVRAAFADDDKELIGAIVGSHRMLHGCDPKYVEPLYDLYRQRVAPDIYAKLEHHRKIGGWLDLIDRETMAFMSRAYTGTGDAAAKQAQYATLLASYED